MSRILLVDSGRELVEVLCELLTREGLEVETVSEDNAGLARAASGEFDLVILGASLGAAICRELRKTGVDTSVLMLSSKTRPEERVAALRLGADDCVPQSCDPNELVARVEALLRRVPKAIRGPLKTVRFGDVEIHFGLSEVRKGGRHVSLSSKELRLLQYLVSHAERVVSRKELLSNVWEYGANVSSRTIDVHVGWLRQKLEDDPQHPKHITTIRGLGYRFDRDDTYLSKYCEAGKS